MSQQDTVRGPDGGTAPTSAEDLDAGVAAVVAQAAAWTATDLDERIELLAELRRTTWEVSSPWAAAAADAKGIARSSPLRGEDWLSGPAPTLRMLRLLQDTLTEIREHGAPQVELSTRLTGQVVAKVFPQGLLDQVVFPGFTGEVWLQPGVTLEEAEARLGGIYRDGAERRPGTCVVLGAGNVSSIPPMDVLSKLFVEDLVCVLKMSPVNEHLGPHLEQALRPLVDRDLLRVVYGGAEVGRHLTDHDDTDQIHVTGSDRTYEAIVFGTGEEGERRKEADDPRLSTPVTAELGNVSPVIVVPGPWSPGDLAFHGDNIASMLVNNAGFNCIAARVIVNHAAWSRRRDLLDAVRASLARAEERDPYYPGARERWEQLTSAHPRSEVYGTTGDDRVPFTLIPDVAPEQTDARAFTTEAFCGVMAETALDAPRSVPDYIEQAVEFCNDTLWGTLSASILVHPRSLKDPGVALALERAIEDLRYGSVVVNHWSAVAYGMVSTSWGAWPGHHRTDIQSGTGIVHNTSLVPDVQKSVVRGPFRPPLTPPWLHTHRRLHEVAPRAAELEATGSPKVLPTLLWHAARG